MPKPQDYANDTSMPNMRDLLNDNPQTWLSELLASKGWALVKIRLERAIEEQRNQLEFNRPVDETNVIRGRISGLRTALSLPTILLKESRSAERLDSKITEEIRLAERFDS